MKEKESGLIMDSVKDNKELQQRLIAAQELREEAKEYGLKLKINDSDGTITLFHGTSKISAEKIMKEGFFPQSFFSHCKTKTGYYDEPPKYYANVKHKDGIVIEIHVDARKVSFVSGTGEFYAEKSIKKKNGIWA